MNIRNIHVNRLRAAEQQFRLACTTHFAVSSGAQSLDVPIEWVFGRHRVSFEDFALRQDQAHYAASLLDREFEIKDVIRLSTDRLQGVELDWRHYGGPLAIFYFGRYIRESLLNDPIDRNRAKPLYPLLEYYQQGRLILRRIDRLPEGAVERE